MPDQIEHPKHPAEQAPNDFEKIATSLKEHPLRYVAAVLVVAAAVLGSMVYTASAQARSESSATELARAIRIDDRAARIPALDAIAAEFGPLTAEALYSKGETAFRLEDYDAAKAAFEKLVSEHPDFQFTPDAIEGIGNVEETNGNFEAAIVNYLDVQVKYPDSYAARRQNYNLGRAYAAQGKIEEAIGAYRRQAGEFADSVIASRATHELHKYQITHPDIYKKFEQQFTDSTSAEDSGIELFVVPEEGNPMTVEEAQAQGDRENEERERLKSESEAAAVESPVTDAETP